MRTLLECYKILEEYPNGMTKDQFYRVARINKQHAKYLLDFGLVPCINTGKKTRKYHIATHDVITYLCDREDHPEKYKVPTGFYIGKNGCSKRHPDKSAAEIIRFNFTEPEKTGLYTMWEKLTVGYDDLLTTPEVSELTGYSAQSIQRWCNQKILVGFKIRGTLRFLGWQSLSLCPATVQRVLSENPQSTLTCSALMHRTATRVQ